MSFLLVRNQARDDIMAANRATAAQLAYVPATAVEATLVEFARLPVETTDRARVGELAGLVIDVARRRLRFLVVENSHWAGRAGRLVPFTQATLDRTRGALRLEASVPDVFQEFDPAAFQALSKDELWVPLR